MHAENTKESHYLSITNFKKKTFKDFQTNFFLKIQL